MMQRLFSTFPAALPGAGLLILRMAGALSLVSPGFFTIDSGPEPMIWILAATAACCLILGYCTPIAASIQAGGHLWALIYFDSLSGIRLVMISLGVSLVLLGPGAWSVDARLYGRRRVDLDSRS
jgi:putative oxidoreductase